MPSYRVRAEIVVLLDTVIEAKNVADAEDVAIIEARAHGETVDWDVKVTECP